MAEAMVMSLLEAVAKCVSTLAAIEALPLWNYDKELKKLQDTLETIRGVVADAEEKQVKDRAVKGWVKRLKDVAYDADDLLDDIATDLAELRRARDTESNPIKALLNFSRKSISFWWNISRGVKGIRESMDAIAKDREDYGLEVGARSTEVRQQTISYHEESRVFGREEDKRKIAEFLMAEPCNDHNPDVIAIVGIGGLGKTTLARLVYNDDGVRNRFTLAMWICVSNDNEEGFDVRKIALSIIESATGSTYNGPISMEHIQLELRNKLRDHRFLLVLDDVWNERRPERWNSLRILLTSGASGSKVIVTTRSERVADIVRTVPFYTLEGLSGDFCWRIFEGRAFAVGGAQRTHDHEAIGKEIVKKCDGLPLAAEAMGSLMFFKREAREWLAVKDSEIWELHNRDDVTEIMPALRLSYTHLPPELKPCFAYCSIFPKDYKFELDDLVQLWMAEGLLATQKESIQDMRDLGHQYLNDLISRSLLQKNYEHIMMHDLMHDLACFILGDSCSNIDLDFNMNIPEDVCYLSVTHRTQVNSSVAVGFRNAKKIRSLFYDKNWHPTTIEHHWPQEVQDVVFDLKRLRALHLRRFPE